MFFLYHTYFLFSSSFSALLTSEQNFIFRLQPKNDQADHELPKFVKNRTSGDGSFEVFGRFGGRGRPAGVPEGQPAPRGDGRRGPAPRGDQGRG